ncbi:AI-2E family transporter [Marinagarivorans algicola]|uniref:AI-2E family transporter n=1 Tax=Marinagarivorans algicola TaxID=1513270 RepID=UPI0006B4AB35|nr:AI-2E family transporter [Marinagarivorans algicola]
MEKKIFTLLMLFFTCIFIWLISPFYSAILWAVAIAIIFYPVKIYLENYFSRKKTLATVITLVLCCIIVIIPMTMIVTLTVNEAQILVEKVKSDEINADKYIEQMESAAPVINNSLEKIGLNIDKLKEEAHSSLKTLGTFLSKSSFSFGKSTIEFFLNVGVMLYLAFFFLRDGKKISNIIFNALPLGDARERRLFDEFKEVTRATVKGNIVVASLQGFVGGLAFWCLDIPGAALWMFVMAVASMIPAIGAAIVWVPVMCYFFLVGEYMDAIILLVIGCFVISLLDNLLRPILVGRDTKMPDYIIFISTIGGIALFGINGFIIGPIIAAMFFVSWSIFIKEVKRGDDLYKGTDVL